MGTGVDAAIAALAVRQHGNVTRQQLLALGLGDPGIAHRIQTGRLHRVHAGVYAVGTPPVTALQRAAAAVLACGPGAALSHDSAMALWGFTSRWPGRSEVTTTGDRRPAGIIVHRSPALGHRDLRKHYAIPVTSAARTLLDCTPRLTERALARTVNDALLSGHVKRSHLAELLRRCPRRPGASRLARFVNAGDGPTRSEFEDTFLVFCERFGFPRPRVNVTVAGREVDAFFEAERLIVELDGWKFHSSRDAFERDRSRDADAMAQGLGTVRITWERLRDQPGNEADRLHAILRTRRADAA
ncbi:MAG: hypothetical protein ACR2OB_15060 [Solirubrobacteraceae bacterium]